VTVDGSTIGGDSLAQRFEEHRDHLRAVAQRMLGSRAEAEDAVQEAWLRLSRAEPDGVANLRGWLTTVVARLCLDVLRSRRSRPEVPWAQQYVPEPVEPPERGTDPEHQALLADSVGSALLVVLETLGPAERIAFVLHDLFAVPFDEVAAVLGRTPEAVKQLASRARRRVRGQAPEGVGDPVRQRAVVRAFLAASRDGDLTGLLALLDPGVVLRADAAAVRAGADVEVRGAEAVARTFSGRAQAAQLALVDGVPGAVWSVGGRPRVVFGFAVSGGRVVGIELLADADRLGDLTLTVLED
jgi:RNA polymerase sigma-70 factor (ECF subfamily)